MENKSENMIVSLRVPDAPIKTTDRDDGPNLKLELNATNPKIVDSSIELSKEDSAHDYN